MDTIDSVSFKAYLKRDGQDVEVRRFGVDGMVVTSLIYLRGKIQAIFPSIKNDQFSIYWQDSDMDTITIDSDEELVEALAASTSRPVKIFINDRNSEKEQQGPSSGDGARLIHAGVTCDGCEGPVSGNRFMCLHCADFDLCAVCQATGKHPDHIMLRIPVSLSESLGNKFSRKALGRLQKFAHHVDRRMNRGGETSTVRSNVEDLFGCTRENVPQSGCPARPFLPRPRDIIIEHKGLVEYLRALGVPVTTASSQPQPGTSATSGSGTQNQAGNASGFQANNYLGNVGQALAALLEPLGVAVTVDPRYKANQTQPAAAPVVTPTTPVVTPASPAPTAAPTTPSPSAALASEPLTTQSQPGPSAVRRNSDDWTLLNRESPNRHEEVAMDVDTSGASGRTPAGVYPELPKEPASAPAQPRPDTDPQIERQIQEAINQIRGMGFNFDNAVLYELLKKENCNIASALEILLSNKK